MNWDALGAIAEAGGAIAVVATLVYLSIQVGHSYKSTRADINQRLNDEMAQINRDVYLNPEFASLLTRAGEKNTFEDLDPEERTRMHRYYATVLNRSRQVFDLNKAGIIDDGARDYLGSTGIQIALRRSLFRDYLSFSRDYFDPEFMAYIDELASNNARVLG